jgi:prepilin-type N-terminal cleavage/methylation domain-containing protein
MKDRGFTLIELLVVVAIFGTVAALAIPGLLRARIAANEGSAIGAMRAVLSAQVAYNAAGPWGYSPSLAQLATPFPAASAAFISPDLATDPSVKAGFEIAVQAAAAATPGAADANGSPTHSDFYLTAIPLSPGLTGNRAFASNATATIYFDPSGVAPAEAAMRAGGGALVLQ